MTRRQLLVRLAVIPSAIAAIPAVAATVTPGTAWGTIGGAQIGAIRGWAGIDMAGEGVLDRSAVQVVAAKAVESAAEFERQFVAVTRSFERNSRRLQEIGRALRTAPG